jgi:hypothetical protein
MEKACVQRVQLHKEGVPWKNFETQIYGERVYEIQRTVK